jgi:hypothetical protein
MLDSTALGRRTLIRMMFQVQGQRHDGHPETALNLPAR